MTKQDRSADGDLREQWRAAALSPERAGLEHVGPAISIAERLVARHPSGALERERRPMTASPSSTRLNRLSTGIFVSYGTKIHVTRLT